jgi:hypothetical protein
LYGVILSSRTLVCKAADFGLAFVGKDFNWILTSFRGIFYYLTT